MSRAHSSRRSAVNLFRLTPFAANAFDVSGRMFANTIFNVFLVAVFLTSSSVTIASHLP